MEETFIAISGFVGVLVSLILAYVPVVEKWYNSLEAKAKVLVNAGLVALACIIVFVLSCTLPDAAGAIGVTFPCTTNAAIQVIKMIGMALIANQTTYLVAVRKFK